MADEATTPPPAEGAAAPEGGEAAAAPPANKKKLLLLVSIGVAVVGILVAVGVVFLMGGKKAGEQAAEQGEHTQIPDMFIHDVPEFNLSLLSDDPNGQHFVKMRTSIELEKQGDGEAVEKMLPKLQDDWGGFLRQMRMTDLQGSANLQRLKEGLLRRANQSLDPVKVKAVYIRELLIQ